MRVLVAGAGGFIGGHLVKKLLSEGFSVRAVDIKPIDKWWQFHPAADNWNGEDLRLKHRCIAACKDIDHVYNFAADMGGMGFIESNKALCMLSVLINTHLLQAAVAENVQRYFYASSACVYKASRQSSTSLEALRESDAYPAMPEDGYGWEKLFSERMCRHFMEDFRLQCRVARFHNIYGPHGSWNDGREKAPAALCRKIAEAKKKDSGEIEVWGDGTRTRSFTYIDDCIDGIRKIMDSDILKPINLGSSEQVSIDTLITHISNLAKYPVRRKYDKTKPLGVHGRNSDNDMILDLLGWEPTTPLKEGLKETYDWIEREVTNADV